jgi:NADH-quinone oxidoreductase subunit H
VKALIDILLKSLLIIVVALSVSAYLVYFERKVVAYIQERYGPNRVGPYGLLQIMADAVKLLFKEEIVIPGANRFLYHAGPVIVASLAFLPLCVIPFSKGFVVADINVAVVFVLAVGVLSIYGILLGGWASNSKYPLLGGLRSAAQLVSYEVAMGIAILALVVQTGSLSMVEIVERQRNLFNIAPQFLGFFVFLLAGMAEINRLPFDLPEAESELVGGYHTEFSSMKFALFFLGEYTHLLVFSALTTALYLGGYWGPLKPGIHWFLLKMALIVYILMWIRWTFPRLRFDQLMGFGWKVLVPLALINLLFTSVLKVVL